MDKQWEMLKRKCPLTELCLQRKVDLISNPDSFTAAGRLLTNVHESEARESKGHARVTSCWPPQMATIRIKVRILRKAFFISQLCKLERQKTLCLCINVRTSHPTRNYILNFTFDFEKDVSEKDFFKVRKERTCKFMFANVEKSLQMPS